MKRLALRRLLLALVAAGVAAVSLLFVSSLRPSERARARAIVLQEPIPDLGTFRVYDERNSRLFIVRTAADEVWAYTVPLRNGKVRLPDMHWWSPYYDCADFRPDSDGAVLLAGANFHCHGPNVPASWEHHWHWHLNGENVEKGSGFEKLPSVKIDRLQHMISVYKWAYWQ